MAQSSDSTEEQHYQGDDRNDIEHQLGGIVCAGHLEERGAPFFCDFTIVPRAFLLHHDHLTPTGDLDGSLEQPTEDPQKDEAGRLVEDAPTNREDVLRKDLPTDRDHRETPDIGLSEFVHADGGHLHATIHRRHESVEGNTELLAEPSKLAGDRTLLCLLVRQLRLKGGNFRLEV